MTTTQDTHWLYVVGADAWIPDRHIPKSRLYFKTHSISQGEKLNRVLEIDYQRNGISGEGFHVVKFINADGITLVATVFDAKKHVAVIDPLDLTSHWRGDVFEDGLRFAINWWDSQR